MIRTAHRFDRSEISALLQVGRAALSSPDRTPDALTSEGLILLLDLIEEQLSDRSPSEAPDPEQVVETLRRQAARAIQNG